MKILLGLFILAFIGLYVILGTVKRIMRMFMGEPEPQPKTKPRKQSSGGLNTSTAKQRKKVISKDEGEYVDYEEIKNN